MLRKLIGKSALFWCVFSIGCSASGGDSEVEKGDGMGSGNGTGSQPNLFPSGGTGNGSGGGGVNLGGGLSTGSGGSENPSGEYCDGKIKGYVRDLSPYTHRDFEPFAGIKDATGGAYPLPRTLTPTGNEVLDTMIVAADLGANRKPTYGGGATTPTTYGASGFGQWYSDTPGVNLGMEYEFDFQPDPARPGLFFYESKAFFPVNGLLLGAAGAADNPDPSKRANEGFPNQVNYGFTTEIHLDFEYSAGQVFSFQGDDDVFVFINNKRVINLGGVHTALTESVALDSLGLVAGQVYPLDFFHAERHRTNSNFRIESSLKFVNCGTIVVK